MSSSLKHTVVFGYFLSLITHNAVLASHDNQCTYETQENRIINIQDDLGTKLLAALQMASLEHCREACCGQFYGKCNMAFYHENNTQERNCFLALCEPENECRLTTREGFSATRVKKAEKDEDPDWFLTTFLNKLENELEKENKAALSKSNFNQPPSKILKFRPPDRPSLSRNPILLHRQKRNHLPGHVESGDDSSTLTPSPISLSALTSTASPTESTTLNAALITKIISYSTKLPSTEAPQEVVHTTSSVTTASVSVAPSTPPKSNTPVSMPKANPTAATTIPASPTSKTVEQPVAEVAHTTNETSSEAEEVIATPSADIPVEDTATTSSVTELASTVKATTVNSDITTAKLTKCQKEYLEAKSGPSLIGKFVPQCTETGAYSAMQCWGSTGSCWCVDENGEKLEETVMGRGMGRPNCEDATNKQRPTNKEAATQEPVEQTSKSTETTAARQTTLPSRTTTMPPEQQTTQKATTTQRTTTQRATTAQISTTRQRIEPTTRLKQTENPTEMPIKQSTELETITGEPSAASGSDTSSLSQAILEPQDSRNVELPGGNETSASLEKDKAKGGKSSYLSSNGALVAAMCFGVLFMLAVCVLVGKRWYESYQRRHYNKMDYLINGMYN